MATPDTEAQDLLAAVREVFAGHEDQRGTPDAPTKNVFLTLARAGTDVWNAWRAEWPRRENKGPTVDFGGVDFRKAPIDFSGFVFGDEADFSFAQFGDMASLAGAMFGPWSKFVCARFGCKVFGRARARA